MHPNEATNSGKSESNIDVASATTMIFNASFRFANEVKFYAFPSSASPPKMDFLVWYYGMRNCAFFLP